MKIMISFLSLLVVAAGGIAFLGDKFPIPHQGTPYGIVLAVLGVLLVVFAFVNRLLMGFERFMLMLEGAAVAFIGVLKFIPSLLAFIPRDGVFYPLIVMAIGILCLAYGILGMG